MDKPTAPEVERAKQFLKDRIVSRAAEDQISLSDAEISTLTYSEPTANEQQRELANEVDQKIGMDEYEQKIAALIRKAYKDDADRGFSSDWKRNLEALRFEDLYVLVMVRAADIPGAPSGIAAVMTDGWYKTLLTVPTFLLAVIGLAGLLLFFTPLHSLLRTDLSRGVAFLMWLGALWVVGAWSKRRTLRTTR